MEAPTPPRVQAPAGKAAWVVVGQNVYRWRRRGADQSTLLMHAHALDSMDCEQRCKKETNGAVSHQVNPAMRCTASVIERVRQIVGQLARRDAGASVGASVRYFPVPTSMRIEHALRRIHSWRCDEPEHGVKIESIFTPSIFTPSVDFKEHLSGAVKCAPQRGYRPWSQAAKVLCVSWGAQKKLSRLAACRWSALRTASCGGRQLYQAVIKEQAHWAASQRPPRACDGSKNCS